jgi:transcriptional regulator GlxA family with amidase domain
VDAGRVVTSAGVAAGMDNSLYVVARPLGEKVAPTTADQMEYPRTDVPGCGPAYAARRKTG